MARITLRKNIEIKRILYCPRCGNVTLSTEQYRLQMERTNAMWFCPKCGGWAAWRGEYHPCYDTNCPGTASIDTDLCDTCGRSQEELYFSEDSDDSIPPESDEYEYHR